MPHDASNPRQVKDAKIRDQLRRENELADVKALMETPVGRRYIWRYIQVCRPMSDPFTGNSETFRNCGLQTIGKMMFAEVLENCPELYMLMAREAKAREE